MHSVQTFVYSSLLLTGPPIQLNIEGFPLSVALPSHRLQCYLKFYTKVCTVPFENETIEEL